MKHKPKKGKKPVAMMGRDMPMDTEDFGRKAREMRHAYTYGKACKGKKRKPEDM